MFELLFSC